MTILNGSQLGDNIITVNWARPAPNKQVVFICCLPSTFQLFYDQITLSFIVDKHTLQSQITNMSRINGMVSTMDTPKALVPVMVAVPRIPTFLVTQAILDIHIANSSNHSRPQYRQVPFLMRTRESLLFCFTLFSPCKYLAMINELFLCAVRTPGQGTSQSQGAAGFL